MAGRLRKPPVMGGFFQRRENEVEIDNKINLGFQRRRFQSYVLLSWGLPQISRAGT